MIPERLNRGGQRRPNSAVWAARREGRAVARALRHAVQGPGRERDLALQSLKAAGAAVVAWIVAHSWLEAPMALMAPWAAVVLVQATVYRSLLNGLQQLGAIAVGTLLAAGAQALVGNSVLAMALVLPVILLLSNWPRFGDQAVYGPTTALFTLAYGPVTQTTVAHRLLEAGLGAAIGIAVNALIRPPVHLRDVTRSLCALCDEVATVLQDIAQAMRDDDWDQRRTADWQHRAGHLEDLVAWMHSCRRWSHESLRLNPRRQRGAPRARAPLPPLETDQRWARIAAHVSGITRTLANAADAHRDIPSPDREALAHYGDQLALLASACRMHGEALGRSADLTDVRGELRGTLDEVQDLNDSLMAGLANRETPMIAALGALLVEARNLLAELQPEEAPRES